jgi:hypothetical protein
MARGFLFWIICGETKKCKRLRVLVNQLPRETKSIEGLWEILQAAEASLRARHQKHVCSASRKPGSLAAFRGDQGYKFRDIRAAVESLMFRSRAGDEPRPRPKIKQRKEKERRTRTRTRRKRRRRRRDDPAGVRAPSSSPAASPPANAMARLVPRRNWTRSPQACSRSDSDSDSDSVKGQPSPPIKYSPGPDIARVDERRQMRNQRRQCFMILPA